MMMMMMVVVVLVMIVEILRSCTLKVSSLHSSGDVSG